MTDPPGGPSLVASLCFIRPDVDSSEQALRLLGAAAVEQGYARDTFPVALLSREKRYPTGLSLPVPMAIPHTDCMHVRRPALAALVPADPLTFGEMGSPDRSVEARLILMLLVDDPAAQVDLLGRLISALRRPDLEAVLFHDLSTPEQLAERFATLLAG